MHLICLSDVLEASFVRELRAAFERAPRRDGAATAGWAARAVKFNEQLDGADPHVAGLRERVRDALSAHPGLRQFAWPRRLSLPLLSRYGEGMQYGRHVDDALMDRGTLRTDLAFTVFLSEPDDYDGGALELESAAGAWPIKLPAGSAVLYEAGALHRVAPVTRGVRLAAVGWIQSQVRLAAQREVLFDLERTRRALHEREGDSEAFATLSRCSGALLRLWAEP
jgi:PKHD-type hydroxylase